MCDLIAYDESFLAKKFYKLYAGNNNDAGILSSFLRRDESEDLDDAINDEIYIVCIGDCVKGDGNLIGSYAAVSQHNS